MTDSKNCLFDQMLEMILPVPLSVRQSVELFHLSFLRVLTAGTDKQRFVLKGGCNLRFFFGSPRYSEDADVDAVGIPKDTLKNKVDRLLASPALAQPLRAHGIEITDSSAPKQTELTQRWKLGLRVPGMSAPVRTKVEFSRRGSAGDAAVEPVSSELLTEYRIPSLLLGHYTAPAAILQKIAALAMRSETQARDIFDLQVLFARPGLEVRLPEGERALLDKAIERATSLGFDEFKSQVVAYLSPDMQPLYDRDAWEQLQLDVAERLEALR